MSERPIAYVMEQTLGSITHYLNLRRQSEEQHGTERWLPIEFSKSRLPWTLTGSLKARQAIGAVLDEVDGIFIHTTTLAPLSVDYFRKKHTVLSSDGTPMNKIEMRREYGMKPESRTAREAKRRLFKGIFAQATAFVAWSNWTRASFIEDYGCPEADVVVIPPGIDLELFAAGDRSHELPRLLFVGGDFERKGGDSLLRVFRRRLRGRAELDIVTNQSIPAGEGVRVHHHVQANSPALRRLYAESDVFVLPTRADCYSLVCMEALAAGLPLIVTQVGGIPDMIEEGKTGHVVAPNDEDGLGDALEMLIDNPGIRKQMGVAARAAAELRFDGRNNCRRLFEFVRSRC
jgi:glycosyltransferase involved in cell wall biosynthesis